MDTVTILGGDARQYYLAKALQKFCTVRCFEVEHLPDDDPEQALRAADVLALPIPVWTVNGLVRSGQSSGIPLKSKLHLLKPGCRIFGGDLGELHGTDYLRDERLLLQNTAATAEGAIRIIMQELPITVSGSKILVIGFGRIGKMLTRKLRALNAEVTVSVRSEKDFRTLASEKLPYDATGVYQRGLAQYDCIVNTVPAVILSAGQIGTIAPSCLVLELASGGGGLAAVPPSLHYIRAPGLPGTDAPKSIAEQMARMILEEAGV